MQGRRSNYYGGHCSVIWGVCIRQVRLGSRIDSLYFFPTIVFLPLLYSLGRQLDAGQTVHCFVIWVVCISQVRLGSRIDSLYYFPTIVFLPLLYLLGRRLDAGQADRRWADGIGGLHMPG